MDSVPSGFHIKSTTDYVTFEKSGEVKPTWQTTSHFLYWCEKSEFQTFLTEAKEKFFANQLDGIDGICYPKKPRHQKIPIHFQMWSKAEEELQKIGDSLAQCLKLKGTSSSPYMYLRIKDEQDECVTLTHPFIKVKIFNGRIPRKAFLVRKLLKKD